jgi:hypothetical protein
VHGSSGARSDARPGDLPRIRRAPGVSPPGLGADRSAMTPTTTRWIVAILLLAVAVKLPYIWYLDGRFYLDVIKSVNFGSLVDRGIYAIDTDVISNKTFVGPLLCFRLFDAWGADSLKVLNLVVVLAICWGQVALGRGYYAARTVLAALLLVAFYTGTNRNVVAGEPEDTIAAFCLTLAVLLYVRGRSVLLAGLVMGLGFLFKYWVAIFFLGVATYLLARRAWRDLAVMAVGMALPFAALSVIDHGASLRGVLVSEHQNRGFAGWKLVAYKLVSTGMIVAVPASAWAWWRRRDDRSTLFFCVSISFFVYVLVTGHAWPANFIMMACLVFSGFLVVESLLPAIEAVPAPWRRRVALTLAGGWVLVTTALTAVYLDESTVPISLFADRAAARALFPYNPLP